MKPKYYIIKYERKKKPLLAVLYEEAGFNEKSDTYIMTLERHRFFGLLKDTVVRNVELPRSLNHARELTNGRQFIFN